MLNNILLLK